MAVAINLTIGDNGIFTKAQIAVVRNENASVYEQLQMVVADYQIDAYETGNDEEILNRLKTDNYVTEDSDGNNIVNVENLMKKSMQTGKGNIADGDVYVIEQRERMATSVTADITENNMDYYLVYYDDENIDIELGLAFEKNTNASLDWNEIFETAEKHPEQSETNEAIGIDSDGNPVNMDLWNIVKMDIGYSIQGEDYSGTDAPGYLGKIENGKIEGKIPKYIKKSGDDKFYEITELYFTFAELEDLIYAPEIPESVINMIYTFENCTNLTEAPTIPNSVTDMSRTFYNCTSLTKASTIPNSVTDMYNTFLGCSSLTGILEINANPSYYDSCFYGAATADNANLVLTGSSTMLQELLETKSDDSHITIQK